MMAKAAVAAIDAVLELVSGQGAPSKRRVGSIKTVRDRSVAQRHPKVLSI